MVLLNYNTYLSEPLKLVEKTFAFYRKSAKTAKVLYRGGFVVYSMYIASYMGKTTDTFGRSKFWLPQNPLFYAKT